jgi:ribosomal protein S18 acetylase RimI-like enzyme
MFVRANKEHIEILVEYKRKMVVAMEEFHSPVFIDEIDTDKLREKLLKDLEDENFYFILVKHKDKYIGFMIFNIVRLPLLVADKYILHISNIFVDDEYRREGFAENLLNYAIETAKRNKCTQVELSVFENNPAKFLYKKIGFKVQDLNMKYPLSE